MAKGEPKMGNSFRKMFDKLFGNREMRVVMLVRLAAILDAANFEPGSWPAVFS